GAATSGSQMDHASSMVGWSPPPPMRVQAYVPPAGVRGTASRSSPAQPRASLANRTDGSRSPAYASSQRIEDQLGSLPHQYQLFGFGKPDCPLCAYVI